jgi:hypothetical protein
MRDSRRDGLVNRAALVGLRVTASSRGAPAGAALLTSRLRVPLSFARFLLTAS